MRILKECACCGKEFLAVKKKQIYCCRKCFKKMYRKKQKELENTFPKWTCFNCGSITQLCFDPRKSYFDWRDYRCPICGVKVLDGLK